MLIIRLRRIGKKNKPTYRIVVAEHSNPIDGKFTADLGFYNPHTKKTGLDVKEVSLWLDKGAKPSNSVSRILQHEKLKHKSIIVHVRNRKPKAELKSTAKEAPKAAPTATETTETETVTTEAENATETPDTQPEVIAEDNAPTEEPTPEA